MTECEAQMWKMWSGHHKMRQRVEERCELFVADLQNAV